MTAASCRRNPEDGPGQDLDHLGALRTTGVLLGTLDAELARGTDPAAKVALEEIEGRFVCWLAAAENPLRPAPIPWHLRRGTSST
ncbi:hypothetical protein [Streptomyces sp. NPDC102282]|uniref:hypothetical protein n=1 Tax=Streptomyces sp. NPDC102282 TaxID=3366154 RepID=UPI0038179B1A